MAFVTFRMIGLLAFLLPPALPQQSQRRYAIGLVICKSQNSKAHSSKSDNIALSHAAWWFRSLQVAAGQKRGNVDHIAIVSGFHAHDLRNESWDRIIEVQPDAPYLRPHNNSNHLGHRNPLSIRETPRGGEHTVHYRRDETCGALKLAAWNLTEYDGILLSEPHLCFNASFDSLAWFEMVIRSRSYFYADFDASPHHYNNLNTRMIFLKPSDLIFQLLNDKAAVGNVMQHTKKDQNIIETIFGRHWSGFVKLPSHEHHKGFPNERSCKYGYEGFSNASLPRQNTLLPTSNFMSRSETTSLLGIKSQQNPRFAVATLVCDSCELALAKEWLRSFDGTSIANNNVDRVAFVISQSIAAALRNTRDRWNRIIDVSNSLLEYDSSQHTQTRITDESLKQSNNYSASCTSHKLVVWLHTEYDAILLTDTDVRLKAFDTTAWFQEKNKAGNYFGAPLVRGSRSYDELDTRLLFLRPEGTLGQMLIDKSASFNNLRPAQKLKYALEATYSPHIAGELDFPIYKFVSTPCKYAEGTNSGFDQRANIPDTTVFLIENDPSAFQKELHENISIRSNEARKTPQKVIFVKEAGEKNVESLPMSKNAKHLVALVVRGQAFREGGQQKVITNPDPQPQRRAFESVVSELIRPLQAFGRTVELFADAVIAPHENYAEYEDILRGPWLDEVGPTFVRLESRHRKPQLNGLVSTLQWMNTSSPGILTRAKQILLTRIDLIFKKDLNLPLQYSEKTLSVLYKLPDTNRVRIGDTLFWIPRGMVQRFISDATKAPLSQLHHLHRVLPCELLYYTFHNTDTMRGWNPVYKMTGRPSRGVNGASFTRWNDRNIFHFMHVRNTTDATSSNARHRFRFVPQGLDGGSTLEILIELEGILPPFDGLNKTVQVMLTGNEVYFVYFEPAAKLISAAHVVLPVTVDARRQEITWSTPNATSRVVHAMVAHADQPFSPSVTSLLIIRAPASKNSTKTPPDFVPLFQRSSKNDWKSKYEMQLSGYLSKLAGKQKR